MNESFKIIAIRTREKPKNIPTKNGVRLDYMKVLESNTIYPFFSTYKFPQNDFINIISEPIIDLYSVNKTVD